MRKISLSWFGSQLMDIACIVVAFLALFPVTTFLHYEYLQMFIFFIKYDIILPDIVGVMMSIGFCCLVLILYVIFVVAMQTLSRGLKEFYHQNIKKKIT